MAALSWMVENGSDENQFAEGMRRKNAIATKTSATTSRSLTETLHTQIVRCCVTYWVSSSVCSVLSKEDDGRHAGPAIENNFARFFRSAVLDVEQLNASARTQYPFIFRHLNIEFCTSI